MPPTSVQRLAIGNTGKSSNSRMYRSELPSITIRPALDKRFKPSTVVCQCIPAGGSHILSANAKSCFDSWLAPWDVRSTNVPRCEPRVETRFCGTDLNDEISRYFDAPSSP